MARRGFSLVEMLVVLAITALVLSLLATAYVMELRGIRSAKGLLEMDNDLRAAEQQIRSLLRQRHFEGDLRVSEIDPNDPNRQPKAGFFAVIEGGPEPLPPGVTSQPEIYVKDGLNFTVRLIGNTPTDFFETLAPPALLNVGYPESRYQQGPTYRSQWAEIAIFLSPQPDVDDPTKQAATVPIDHPAHPANNGPAAKLHRLHLRKLLLLPSHFAKGPNDFDSAPTLTLSPSQYDLSVDPNSGQVNKPTDVLQKSKRFWPATGTPQPLSGNRQGEDVILQNVVSFDVKLILIQGGSVNVNDGGYDSTSNQPLQGIWIRIRIFNPKTQQMRDMVIVEAL